VLVLVLVLRVVLCRRGVGVRIRGVVVRGLLLLGRRCAGVGWLVGVASLLLLLVVVGRYLLAGLEAVVGGRAVLVLWRAVVLLAAIVVLLLAGLLLGWVAGLLVVAGFVALVLRVALALRRIRWVALVVVVVGAGHCGRGQG